MDFSVMQMLVVQSYSILRSRSRNSTRRDLQKIERRGVILLAMISIQFFERLRPCIKPSTESERRGASNNAHDLLPELRCLHTKSLTRTQLLYSQVRRDQIPECARSAKRQGARLESKIPHPCSNRFVQSCNSSFVAPAALIG